MMQMTTTTTMMMMMMVVVMMMMTTLTSCHQNMQFLLLCIRENPKQTQIVYAKKGGLLCRGCGKSRVEQNIRSDFVSRGRPPGHYIPRVPKIRPTSPELYKADHLYQNKITQPLTSPEFPESDHAPPEGLKPDHLNISRGTKTRPSLHLPRNKTKPS